MLGTSVCNTSTRCMIKLLSEHVYLIGSETPFYKVNQNNLTIKGICKFYKVWTFENKLIFFMFIRFPAILMVKIIDSYLHELCIEYFT